MIFKAENNTCKVEAVKDQFKVFLDELKFNYEDINPGGEEDILEYMDNIHLFKNQFVYIHHMKSGKFYHKGFADCLGFEFEELTPDFFIRHIHPADLSMYFKISRALLNFVVDNSRSLVPFDSSFQVNYRVRKVDGSYISILRQNTPFIKNKNHRVEAYISFCSDISGLSQSNQIRYHISGPMKEKFPQYLDGSESSGPLFSERELEILRLLKEGCSSNRISETLFISINTVNTHRKSLMKKANVNKTIDLISFAVEKGYL